MPIKPVALRSPSFTKYQTAAKVGRSKAEDRHNLAGIKVSVIPWGSVLNIKEAGFFPMDFSLNFALVSTKWDYDRF